MARQKAGRYVMLASPIRWPLGVSEVADHQARARGPLGAHTAPSAKALGLLQRGLDVRPATCLFELDDRAWTVRTEAGQVQGQPRRPALARPLRAAPSPSPAPADS